LKLKKELTLMKDVIHSSEKSVISTKLHSIAAQKIILFIVITVRTSNPLKYDHFSMDIETNMECKE
jgi:hypothetical protein